MTRKRPHSGPAKADDLKLINGIGPAVEIRLHGVGIFTFAQLAGLSPADVAAAVADLAGLSSERILKLDWIGQARKLAAESTLDQPEWIDQAHKLALQSTIETQKNMKATTGVELHQSPNEQHPGEQLGARKSTKSPQEEEIEPSASVVAGIITPTRVSPGNSFTVLLHMSKPELVSSDTNVPQNMLDSNQPYDVHFTLHLSDVSLSHTSTLNYTASAYGMALNEGTRHPMGVVRGTIKPKEEIAVAIRGASLPQGIYWLEAEALVPRPPTSQETPLDRELLVMVKGSLFEIY